MHWYEWVRSKFFTGVALLFLSLTSGYVYAQGDTLLLEGVEVTAHKLKKHIAGVFMQELQPADAVLVTGKSLDRWIQNNTNLYLRGNGPGSSMGVSIRGSSTSQTQILINGIPFENPGLATSDISNLPTGIFSGMSIYRGSAAAYLGNAAIGGSVLMETAELGEKNEITQTVSAGSFGSYQGVSKIKLGNQKFTSATRLYYQQAQNDFLRPHPTLKSEKIKQPNARFESKGFAQDFNFYGSGKSKGQVFLWAGDTRRQLPPINSKPQAKASQHDESYRVQGLYQTEVFNTVVNVNTAIDHGRLNYNDPDASLDEDSEYTSLHAQLEMRKDLGIVQVFGMGIFRQSHVLTEAYLHSEKRTSPAVVGGVNARFWEGKTTASAVVRQEFLNGKALPVIPVVSIDQKVFEGFHLFASAGKSYRIPGLNDMFWNPGGNPDLKPESGWFQEGGVSYDVKQNDYKLSLKLTGFHRLIENWIQWAPGPMYWSAKNIKEVRSAGVEGFLEIQHRVGAVRFKHQASALQAKSTNLKPAFLGDKAEGKQLIYMPMRSAMIQESIATKNEIIGINILGRYTDEVFTSTDNRKSLAAYFTIDAEVVSHLKLKHHTLILFGAVRNLLNADYQIQASYAMPGIHYEAGIQLKINLNNNKL